MKDDVFFSFRRCSFSKIPAMIALLLLTAGISAAKSSVHYVITDDDEGGVNTASIYRAGPGPSLTLVKSVETGGVGVNNGETATKRVLVLSDGSAQCLYVTDAGSNDIAAFVIQSSNKKLLEKVGNFKGSKNDVAQLALGLAASDKYVYASFYGSGTIATFRLNAGCKLRYVKDIHAGGLNGGHADGMAVHGTMMVVAYADGSIQSFNVAAGVPTSNNDRQLSAGYNACSDDAIPASVDITQDGHFAIFGDAGAFVDAEVSDISSGKLKPTTNYGCPNYGLGGGWLTAEARLSPDESLLFISAQSQALGYGQLTAVYFDKTTGALTYGCTGTFRSPDVVWVSGLAVEKTTGNGGVVYVVIDGNGIFIPTYVGFMEISSGGGQCTLNEPGDSPVQDTKAANLRSIAAYPPRPF